MPAILCPSCRKLINSDAARCPFCDQARPGMFGLTTALRRFGLKVDFPHIITIICVALYLFALVLDPGAIFTAGGMMTLLSPSGEASLKTGMTGAVPVLYLGRWWTVITAIYLHGGLLHIFFNMMWVRQLGPLVENLFGRFRLIVIFTLSGVCGFILSSYMGNANTLGASGSIFGLLAAAIVYGRQRGSSLFTRQFLQWAVIMFVFGLVFPGVDNWAHAGGFAGGYVSALTFSRQGEHEGLGTYLLAAVCVLMTLLAFALQFLANVVA
jgi:rhomboid protease GluP